MVLILASGQVSSYEALCILSRLDVVLSLRRSLVEDLAAETAPIERPRVLTAWH